MSDLRDAATGTSADESTRGHERRVRLRLFLLRHGETDTHATFYGHRDVPLSERGRAQARAQASWLERVDLAAVYSSDLTRARDGARMLLPSLRDGEAPAFEQLPALREMYLGAFEGLEYAQARARYPLLAGLRYEELLDTRLPGGGECVRDVDARLHPCATQLIQRHLLAGASEHPARDSSQPRAVAIVAHNTVLRLLLAHSAGVGAPGYTRFRLALGSISRIDFDARPDAEPWRHATIVFTNLNPQV